MDVKPFLLSEVDISALSAKILKLNWSLQSGCNLGGCNATFCCENWWSFSV